MPIHMHFGESRPAFAEPKATATFPEGTENLTPINPADLKAWLESKIAFEKEAGDPDNYLDGLQYMMRILKIRERCDPKRTPEQQPVLDGLYAGREGLADAVGALVSTMLHHSTYEPSWHVMVWEV
jgi:hypothetical protein